MKTRGFEKVAKYMDVEFPMPERKTQFSAGYDISAAEEVVLEPGKLVMEVKFTELLPGLVRQLLPPKAAEFTALSKYLLCREKTEYRSAPGGWTNLQGGYYEYKGRYQKIGAGRLHHRGAEPV